MKGHTETDTQADTGLLGQVTLQMLRETFDHWSVGRANGRLVAFRSGAFTPGGPESLIRRCIMADTPEGLAEQLCAQAWLEELSADELETVWREGTAAVRP